jgi:hypothetical protein
MERPGLDVGNAEAYDLDLADLVPGNGDAAAQVMPRDDPVRHRGDLAIGKEQRNGEKEDPEAVKDPVLGVEVDPAVDPKAVEVQEREDQRPEDGACPQHQRDVPRLLAGDFLHASPCKTEPKCIRIYIGIKRIFFKSSHKSGRGRGLPGPSHIT